MNKITKLKLLCVRHDISYKYIVCKNIASYLTACELYSHSFDTPVRTLILQDNKATLTLDSKVLDAVSGSVQYFEKANYCIVGDESNTENPQYYYFFITAYNYVANSGIVTLNLEFDAHIQEYFNNPEYKAIVDTNSGTSNDVVERHFDRFEYGSELFYSNIMSDVVHPASFPKIIESEQHLGQVLWLAVRLNRSQDVVRVMQSAVSGYNFYDIYKKCGNADGDYKKFIKYMNLTNNTSHPTIYVPLGLAKHGEQGIYLDTNIGGYGYNASAIVTGSDGDNPTITPYPTPMYIYPQEIIGDYKTNYLMGIQRIWQLLSGDDGPAECMYLTYHVPFSFSLGTNVINLLPITSEPTVPTNPYTICSFKKSISSFSTPYFVCGYCSQLGAASYVNEQLVYNVPNTSNNISLKSVAGNYNLSCDTTFYFEPQLYTGKCFDVSEHCSNYHSNVIFDGVRTELHRKIYNNDSEFGVLTTSSPVGYGQVYSPINQVISQEQPLYNEQMTDVSFFRSNGFSVLFNGLSNAISIAQGNMFAIPNAVQTASDVTNKINNTKTTGGNFNVTNNVVADGYYLHFACISDENKKTLAKHFNRYGYQKQSFVPIFNRTRTLYDYCKTQDCSIPEIHNVTNRIIIEQAFNNGVTKIWNDNIINVNFYSYLNNNNAEVNLQK